MNPLLLDLPDTLESDRLHIRPYAPGDGAWLHEVIRANREHLAIAIEGARSGFGLDLTDAEGAETFVRELHADWAARRRCVFGTWEKASGDYVGELWIECENWDAGQHGIGYFVVQEKLGRGYATEAARVGLTLVFEVLGARKATLTCDEDNTSSYRAAERCGFVREGCLREHCQRGDGGWVGQLCYGMLKAEYETGSGSR